jgi:hypothetical protein
MFFKEKIALIKGAIYLLFEYNFFKRMFNFMLAIYISKLELP